MMYKYFIATFLLCCFMNAEAQEPKKLKFHSVNQVGIMQGQGGTFFQATSINGIRAGSFSAGLGIGIDNYVASSIPLFLDVRKDLSSKPQSLFLYMSGGKNYMWDKKDTDWMKYESDPGWYYNMGIGYAIPLVSESLIFSAGYSYKAFEERREQASFCQFGNCPPIKENFSYKLRRISITAGFRF
jgi:hypothetical protein